MRPEEKAMIEWIVKLTLLAFALGVTWLVLSDVVGYFRG